MLNNDLSRFDYKRVDTRTLEGLQRAEALQRQGWRVIQAGLFTVLLERATVINLPARKPMAKAGIRKH